MHKLSLGLIGGGIVAVVLSIVLGWLGFPHFIRSIVKKNARLEKSSVTYKVWQNPGEAVEVYLKFYIFNVTNPKEVQNGSKPHVTERGPYVYREKSQKEKISPGRRPGTLVYRERTFFHFQRNMSVGSDEDLVTFLNVPFVAMASMTTALTDSEFVLEELDSQLVEKRECLFRSERVRDILFDGFSIQPYIEIITDPITQLAVGEVEIPHSFRGGKFAIYKGRNGSDSGTIEIDTGEDSISHLGQIYTWNNSTRWPWWKSDSDCSHLVGTDGSIFPPFLQPKQILQTFAFDLCRTTALMFQKKIVYNSVPGFRFVTVPELAWSPGKHEPNRCFCPQRDAWGCNRSGLIQLSGCKEGAPVSFSSPHFFDADPDIISAIDGIKPEEGKHKSFIDVEPTTGTMMRAAKRLQFNADVVPVPAMASYSKARKMTFPILWAEESMELPKNLMKMLLQLHHAQGRVETARWSLIGVSVICLCLGVIWAVTHKDRIEQAKTTCVQRY